MIKYHVTLSRRDGKNKKQGLLDLQTTNPNEIIREIIEALEY